MRCILRNVIVPLHPDKPYWKRQRRKALRQLIPVPLMLHTLSEDTLEYKEGPSCAIGR